MNNLEKSIKHFEGLKTQHNGKICQFAACALKDMNESRWIPVNERLPNIEECRKDECKFIVTDGKKVYQKFYDFHKIYYGGFYDFEVYGYEKDESVIAWMPMPEPYKEVNK